MLIETLPLRLFLNFHKIQMHNPSKNAPITLKIIIQSFDFSFPPPVYTTKETKTVKDTDFRLDIFKSLKMLHDSSNIFTNLVQNPLAGC